VDKLTSLTFFPSLTPTAFYLEDKTGVDKDKKEERDVIPLMSRFIVALRRIAFCMVSSSVATEPSSATVCLVLRRGGGAHGITDGADVSEADLAGEVGVLSLAGEDGEAVLARDAGGYNIRYPLKREPPPLPKTVVVK
jgi:hypothetical protein